MELSFRKLALAATSIISVATGSSALGEGTVRQISHGEQARVSTAIKQAQNAVTGVGCAPGIAAIRTGPVKFYPSEADESPDVLSAPGLLVTRLTGGVLEVISGANLDSNGIAGGYPTNRWDKEIFLRSDVTTPTQYMIQEDGIIRPDWARELKIASVQAAIKECKL